MKVLNLYAGIGGNRKLWEDVEVTAVEYDAKIAAIYKDLYPNDTVIVGDAHQYLLEHYKEYEFVWGSPPCPTHSITNHFLNAQGVIRYPDMALYQEILLLQNLYAGKFCIENVKPYYEPLIKPQESGRHCFWANFRIPHLKVESSIGRFGPVKSRNGGRTEGENHHKLGFDLEKYDYPNKSKLLNNCVAPEIGLAILDSARNIIRTNNAPQTQLF